jgi:hypothetical protein
MKKATDAKAGKESKAMMKKEIDFMQKKGAPKSMIKHEKAEMKGMKKYADGGMVGGCVSGVSGTGRRMQMDAGK